MAAYRLADTERIVMMARSVSLKCQSCGGKLEVYDDMTRFACGYCGTETLVERRGGTVILRAVEDAIQRVEIGTTKAAAELALARLKQELTAKEFERNRIAAQMSNPGTGYALLGYVLFGVIFGIGFVIANSIQDYGIVLMLLSAIGGIVAMLWLVQRAKKEQVLRFQEPLTILDGEIASLGD